MSKKTILLLTAVPLIPLVYLIVWFTTFDGYQRIRFQCYKISFCRSLSQIFENRKLSRLPALTSALDPFYSFLPFQPSVLPVYYLKVDPADYQSIINQLPAPYSIQFRNTPSPKISGELSYNGKNYKVDFSFRGIGYQHWSEPKKSLRVTIKSGETLEGLDEIDFIVPSDSNYYGFFLNKWAADYLGLYTNEPSLIHVYLNNIDYGPFVKLDRWNQSFLERRGAPNGLIFGDIDPSPGRPLLYQDIGAWKIYDPPNNMIADFSAIEKLLAAFNQPDPQTSFLNMKQIIDIDSFVRWEALAVFFNTRHQDDFHNIRLFLNPVSGKLEFMPVDFAPDLTGKNKINQAPLLDIDYNPLAAKLLADPEIRQNRDRILSQMLNDQEFQNSLWQRYDDLYRQTRANFYRDPVQLESNLRFDYVAKQLKQKTLENIASLKALLNEKK